MSALPAALGRIRPAVEHRLTQVLEDCHRRWEDLGQARLGQFQVAPDASRDVSKRFTVNLPLSREVLLSRHRASFVDILRGKDVIGTTSGRSDVRQGISTFWLRLPPQGIEYLWI